MPSPSKSTNISLLLEGRDRSIANRLSADCVELLDAYLTRRKVDLDRDREEQKSKTLRIDPSKVIDPTKATRDTLTRALASPQMTLALVGYRKIFKIITEPDIEEIANIHESKLVECNNDILVGILSETLNSKSSSAGSKFITNEMAGWLSELDQIPHYNDFQDFKVFAQSLCTKLRELLFKRAREFKGSKPNDPDSTLNELKADLSCTINIAIQYPDGKTIKFFFGKGASFHDQHCDFSIERDAPSRVNSFPASVLFSNPIHDSDRYTESYDSYVRSLIPAIVFCDSNHHSILGSGGIKDTNLSDHKKAGDHEYLYFPLKDLIDENVSQNKICESIYLYHLLCLIEHRHQQPDLLQNPRSILAAQCLIDTIKANNPSEYKNFPDCSSDNIEDLSKLVKLKLKFICLSAFSDLIDKADLHNAHLHPILDDIGLTFMPARELNF